ncbi:hypothetical protein [Frankia sp. AgB32]|uniref:hypothetical protein n=1 Tax=Frankia sp. AgB32 TaxID=631119 RepID=UPI00200D866A|nr:hypothetical protein [Frankia sp. AgB32]MCK9893664.1 hypothetical protein [Frankia sp. AgB32]
MTSEVSRGDDPGRTGPTRGGAGGPGGDDDGRGAAGIVLRALPAVLARRQDDAAAREVESQLRAARDSLYHFLYQNPGPTDRPLYEEAYEELRELLDAGWKLRGAAVDAAPLPTRPTRPDLPTCPDLRTRPDRAGETDPIEAPTSAVAPDGLGPDRPTVTVAAGAVAPARSDLSLLGTQFVHWPDIAPLELGPPGGVDDALSTWFACALLRLPAGDRDRVAADLADAHPHALAGIVRLDGTTVTWSWLDGLTDEVVAAMGTHGIERFPEVAQRASVLLRLVDRDVTLRCAVPALVPNQVGHLPMQGDSDLRAGYRTHLVRLLGWLARTEPTSTEAAWQLYEITEMVASVFHWPLAAPESWWARALATTRAELADAVSALAAAGDATAVLHPIVGLYEKAREWTQDTQDVRLECEPQAGQVVRELRPHYTVDGQANRGRALYCV